jgi:hypothetical protein
MVSVEKTLDPSGDLLVDCLPLRMDQGSSRQIPSVEHLDLQM